MDMSVMIEIYGYIGSVLVVVSMLMSSVVKLRVINTVGSIVSGTYALIIGSFPLALMNISLLIINLYNLFKLLKSEKSYDFVEIKPEDAFLQYFLERFKEDILQYFPEFELKRMHVDYGCFVCCNGDPVGVLLGREKGDGVMEVVLDYSVPTYRDCSVGFYLYAKMPDKGVNKLLFVQNASEVHDSYMKKMGFEQKDGVYVKNLRENPAIHVKNNG